MKPTSQHRNRQHQLNAAISRRRTTGIRSHTSVANGALRLLAKRSAKCVTNEHLNKRLHRHPGGQPSDASKSRT
jgi:hypothetical protein